MDTIKLIFKPPHNLEGVEFNEYDIKVQLNESVLPHSFFNLGSVLSLFQFHFAEFDLFTCGCGEPGCAGFQHSVIQSVNENVISWKFPETNDYKTEKKTYCFEKDQFEKEFKSAFVKVKELEKEKSYHVTILGYEYYDEDESENFVVENTAQESFDWYTDDFQGKQNFHDLLNEEYHEFSNSTFFWVYNGQVAKEGVKLSSLVGNILNQYPRKSHEPFFLAKAKLAMKSIEEMLQGNNTLIEKLAKHSYVRYGLTAYNLIDWYFYETVTAESFDISKLSLKMVKV